MKTMGMNVREGGKVQVLVVGGGPAGCAAAIASAREGKSTLLLEADTALGGMGTMGLVPWYSTNVKRPSRVFGGIAGKIMARCAEAAPNQWMEQIPEVPIHPESLKRIWDEEVTASGAAVLFGQHVCGVTAHNGRMESIVAADTHGLTEYEADVFVDATGNGDVCVWAGADSQYGYGEQHRTQMPTLCFSMANVDTYGYECTVRKAMRLVHSADAPDCEDTVAVKMVCDPAFDRVRDTHLCNMMFAPGGVGFNAGHLDEVNPFNASEVSQRYMQGRQLARQFELGLRKYAPEAFGSAWLCQTAAQLGIRESRRIECDYMLNVRDYETRASFPDEVGRNCYFIDVHRSKEENEERNQKGECKRFDVLGESESYGIPYRCLLPSGLQNVLVAGRCVGSDREVNGSIRVMAPCMVTGEAAGAAASLTVSAENTRDISVETLQSILIQHGAIIHDAGAGMR